MPSNSAALGQLPEMIGGSGALVYASDYPHEHGDGWPALLDRLAGDNRRRVLGETAAELYGLT